MTGVAETEKITLNEAFRRFGVSPATLRYWLDKGELERDYRRGRVVIDVAQIQKKLAERERR